MLLETNAVDELDASMAQLCDAQRLVALSPHAIEADKQAVIRLVRARFGQKSGQESAYIRIVRPDSADELDDEDEMDQETVCARLRLLYAQRPDGDEWRLWLYLWARRVDEALVQRVPALSGAEADRLGTAMTQQLPGRPLLFERHNSEFLHSGRRASVSLSQRAANAQLIFVQLRDKQAALSLLCITRTGLLYHFARQADAIAPDQLYAIARNLNVAVQANSLQFVPVAEAVPFDATLLLYIVNEGARLAQRNQFSHLARWLAHIDAPTVDLFRSHVLRTHYLAHFLGQPEVAAVEEAEEVVEDDAGVMVIDDSTQSQEERPPPTALRTSVTQLAALSMKREDVGDAVLLDVVQLVMRAGPRQCVADPGDWHNKVVLLGRAPQLPAECDLALVPINNEAHWSLLMMTQQHAWYYSSLDGDTYGARVKKILAQALPQLKFAVVAGPVQAVDRECALYVLNMMQYALDGHALQKNIVIRQDERRYTRAGVQATLLQLLRLSLTRDNVVAFCAAELINFWQQQVVGAAAFTALTQQLLSAEWAALAKAVDKLARGEAYPRDTLLEKLRPHIARIKPSPDPPRRRVLVIEDSDDDASSSTTTSETEVEEIEEEAGEALFPAEQEADEHAQRYDVGDPVDDLVAYVAEMRDLMQSELSGKYGDASLWDADFLGATNAELQRLAFGDKIRALIHRSLDDLFYERDRRNQRAYLREPSDAEIGLALARYRTYKA